MITKSCFVLAMACLLTGCVVAAAFERIAFHWGRPATWRALISSAVAADALAIAFMVLS